MCTTSGSLYLHVINSPNEKGKNCHFVQRDIKLPTYNAFTMPYFPNYRLGPESVGTDEQLNTTNNLPFIAPNPSSNHIEIINYEYGQQVQVFNVAGEIVFIGNEKNIDVSAWTNGIYFIKISDNFKNYFLKFIKI